MDIKTCIRVILIFSLLAIQPACKPKKTVSWRKETEDRLNRFRKIRRAARRKKLELGYKVVPMKLLPKDSSGEVDWATAVRKGVIQPLFSLTEENPKIKILTTKILFSPSEPRDGNPPRNVPKKFQKVHFPHEIHTFWLNCNPCHSRFFKTKNVDNMDISKIPEVIKGKEYITMDAIWRGEYCGRCHGKVPFNTKNSANCFRCHIWP